MPDEDRPLSAGDVAAMFGVTTTAVSDWVEAGKLPSFRTPGGHRRFHRADVEALLHPEQPTEPVAS